MPELKGHRDALVTAFLGHADAVAKIQSNPAQAGFLIENWWNAYKDWERTDTFNQAMNEDRMSMRSFESDFKSQVKKTIPMNIVERDRYFQEGTRTPFEPSARTAHDTAFKEKVTPTPPGTFGWTKQNPAPPVVYQKPQRGIDTKLTFGEPANFLTREAKYKAGLLSLSASMVRKNADIKSQCHHLNQTSPHFCFLPLSGPQDQKVIYFLRQYAKSLPQLAAFNQSIRKIRSEMTQVKLAHDYDLGVGLVATHTPTLNLPYKVSYTLPNTVKQKAIDGVKQPPLTVTPELLRERQTAYFERHASLLTNGNEIVIAMRMHHGSFPVYAYYDPSAGHFKCYKIVGGKLELDGRTISNTGVAAF